MNVQESHLTVTTVANVETEPYDLTVLAGPTIVAWAAPPIPGKRRTLLAERSAG